MNCPSCGRALPEDAAGTCPDCHVRLTLASSPVATAVPEARVESLWKQARAAVACYDYAGAVALCEAVLAALPAHEEAARLKTQAGEQRQALESSLRQANDCFNKGQYELALVHFTTVLGLCPTDEASRRKHEMTKLLAGQDLTAYTPRDVRRSTSRWADEVMPSPVSTMVMACVIAAGLCYLAYYVYHRTQQRNRTAEQLYRQIEQRLQTQEYLAGESQVSFQELTTVFGNTRFAKDAVELFERTRLRKLEQASTQLDQAEEYLGNGRSARALELARDVLQWDPKNARAKELIDRAQEVANEFEQQYMQVAMQPSRRPAAPAPAPSPVASAPAPAVGGEAASLSADQVQDAPLDPIIERLVQQGQDRLVGGEYAAAAALWEQALARHGRPHAFLQRLIDKAHELDARSRQRFDSAMARAQTLEQTGDWAGAQAAYREAQVQRPAETALPEKIEQLSVRVQGAAAMTVTMPPVMPPQHTAQVQQWQAEATRYEQSGQWRRANDVYRRWMQSQPTLSVQQQIDLNYIIAAQEARRADGQSSGIERDLVLAQAYFAKGRYAPARQLLAIVLADTVRKPSAGQRAFVWALMGAAYAGEQNMGSAIRAYRQSVAAAPVWYVQHSLAQMLWNSGQYLQAVRQWRALLRRAPQQADVIAALAAGYLLLDDPATAKALMEPLKTWKLADLQRTQWCPAGVRPEYWLGLAGPQAFLAEICDHVAQTWVLLDQPLESLRWHQLAQAERDAEALAVRRLTTRRASWWPWHR